MQRSSEMALPWPEALCGHGSAIAYLGIACLRRLQPLVISGRNASVEGQAMDK